MDIENRQSLLGVVVTFLEHCLSKLEMADCVFGCSFVSGDGQSRRKTKDCLKGSESN
jgi:hypothetical protein